MKLLWIQYLFVLFDKDGNGHLDATEFRDVMVGHGAKMSDTDIDLMFQMADINQDGMVTYDEFAGMMNLLMDAWWRIA